MKNKGVTYGLIVVVGVIWYQVFVRVKSNVLTEDDAQTAVTSGAVRQIFKKRETFSLAANYRDPFSGKLSAEENPVVQPLVPQANPAPPPPRAERPSPPPFVWPSIKYFGMVRETNSVKPLTVLAIDGEYYKLRQGESALDDITIKKVYRDSVTVRYRKRDRTFYRTRL